MRLITFSILTALALLYAGLTVAESAMYVTWDRALRQQKDIQTKVAYFQRLNAFLEQLLRRLAVESQHDPAVQKLLKDHNIKVVVTNPDTNATATPTTPVVTPVPADAQTDKAPQAPPDIQPPSPPHP